MATAMRPSDVVRSPSFAAALSPRAAALESIHCRAASTSLSDASSAWRHTFIESPVAARTALTFLAETASHLAVGMPAGWG
eukprot:CAMPEP_0182943086 /NCGR_PEP_ID=MMETSP0105_2-20130417/51811_1 /TAXON_ID=81532 ORGANISM="Acanthoeca-like sp., Strain 10tr" /NCGR_SAMPLE_ID=MMETSP0105_2 /ASSEMBLY_ACC=CAM_ASM_000205 /LENGTH=80 /DNA_ID=CAMNT_0025082899 /DNA_START=20 /DNA_END=258 /DNA_ORIENTATION=+